jgi:phosphoglycerate kinase
MKEKLDPRLPCIEDADLNGKVVLIRMDHNVVEGGKIEDPYRIDATIPTLYWVIEKGGRPIIMTHIGRPRDKKTGHIRCNMGESVEPVVEYLYKRLNCRFHVPSFPIDPEFGILSIDTSINKALKELKERKIPGIYLPNIRWFRGEEDKGEMRKQFALQLAGLADLFINDAFGSWQAHASTYEVTKYLPSYAGILMQKEISNLDRVINPERPFVAIVAGSKVDTKIGPLKAIYKKVDHLILGGVIYNAYLSARYDIHIKGIPEEEVESARELVEMDKKENRIVELSHVVESDTMEGKIPGRYRTLEIKEIKEKKEVNYLLDVDPLSFNDQKVKDIINGARTIFVNAVMGLSPHFMEGSEALDRLVANNKDALKLFGGGDTLKELRTLCPALYMSAQEDPKYYFFTGGGTVLTAIQEGSPYGLPPVQALIASAAQLNG